MRKILVAALLFSLALGLSAHAERNRKKQEVPELPRLFESIRKGVVCVTASTGGDNEKAIDVTGIVVKGDAEKAVVAVSLTTMTKGYKKFKLHSDRKRSYLSSKKGHNYFAENLRFLEFVFKGSRKKTYGSYSDRVLPVAQRLPVPGEKVFIACAMPDAQPAAIYPAVIGNEVKTKGRDEPLYTLAFDVPVSKCFAFLGAPVVNRMGEIVGVYNVDMPPALSKISGAVTETPLVHPAAGLVKGLDADDKFPERKGLNYARGLTGHWLPVRFGPLTRAWRKALDLPPTTKGGVVTYIYPEGSECGLQVGDVITHIEGVAVQANSWRDAGRFTITFMRLLPSNRSGDTWSVNLKIIRGGEEMEISAQMPAIQNTGGRPYDCLKLGVQFVELGTLQRILNDFPEAFSGVLANRVAGRRLTMAVVRGLIGTVVKEVNGRQIKTVSDLKDVIENSGAFTFRFLVLDTRDFLYKYITITTE